MKRIAIGGNIDFMRDGMFPGYAKAYVNEDYIAAVEAAGGVPIVLPIVHSKRLVREQLECMDGLILSGGWDVDPLCFGEEPHEKLGETLPERDAHDLWLIKAALDLKLPIFGICRGLQILNVALGGTLYQDMSEKEGPRVRHWQISHPDQATHTVETAEGSLMRSILGPEHVTNSFHHMTIKDLAPSLFATARAKDGTIEAVEYKESFPPVYAVQWHPEMMHQKDEAMLALFRCLIEWDS